MSPVANALPVVPEHVSSAALWEKVQEGRGSEDDLKTMVWLSQVLWSASLCPLGQSLIMPVKSAIEGFPEEFSPLFNLEEVKL